MDQNMRVWLFPVAIVSQDRGFDEHSVPDLDFSLSKILFFMTRSWKINFFLSPPLLINSGDSKLIK